MLQEDAQITGTKPTLPTVVHPGAEDIGWQALGPTLACTLFATCVVALRWYTRCRLVTCTGLDDYVISLSMILSWAMCGIVIAAKGEGLGVYDGFIDATHLAKLLTANNALWSLTVNITKASIVLQYLRIFSDRLKRYLCNTLLCALVIAACWAVFGGIFLCRPVAKLWDPVIPGICWNVEKYWISVASINIGLDVLVLILPFPIIINLRLPRKDKLCIILLLVLGFVVCIVSILRLTLVVVTAHDGDYILSGIWAIIWSAIEANIGIACASLLALKPLLNTLFPASMPEINPPAISDWQLNPLTRPQLHRVSLHRSPWLNQSHRLSRCCDLIPIWHRVAHGQIQIPRPPERMPMDLEAGDVSIMDMLRIDSGETYAFAGH